MSRASKFGWTTGIAVVAFQATGDVFVVARRRAENWAEKPIDESALVRETSNR